MNYPKFSVNEPVLIYSKTYPNLNGTEAIVVRREIAKRTRGVTTGKVHINAYRYWTEPAFTPEDEPWIETALRKRPSDFTYNELMESLKTPLPV